MLRLQLQIQCRVFYCDPMNSSQKSHCERNHEFIRYVLPKGEAKDEYTEEEIERLMNHIGSYPRKKWNGQNFEKAGCVKNFKKEEDAVRPLCCHSLR